MNAIGKGIMALVIVLVGAPVTLPVQADEVLQATGSENAESGVAEELASEGNVEEKVPLLEEGEEGEITERGVPRINLKPRPRINLQEKSRPRITIPQNPRPQIKIPLYKVPPGEATKRPVPDLGSFIPNQVIVKLRPGMSLPSSTMKKFGLQEVRRTSGDHILFRFVVPPGMEQIRNPLTVAQELAKHVAVLFAEPNFIGQPDTVPQDGFFKHQWHYFDQGSGTGQSLGGIGLPKVWGQKSIHGKNIRGNKNVVVAVIDTGIVGHDNNLGTVHPDIDQEKILPGFDFISDPASANDKGGRDADPTDAGDALKLKDLADCNFLIPPHEDTWHGTSMAGIIGLGKTNNTEGVAGVNWEVSILPIRVSGRCGYENFDLYDAIRWAAGFEAPDAGVNPNPARIINISLGGLGLCPTLIQEAIDEVVKAKDVIVIAGAGNKTTLAAFHHPSNCTNVISVAASDERGHLASYSNFGPAVTIMAPGGNLLLDVNKDKKLDQVLALYHPDHRDPKIDDNDPKFKEILPLIKDVPVGYAFGRGTSNAAPHVSGVLALWLAEDFSLTREELLKGLQETAFKRNKTQCPNSCGFGLLNADLSSLIKPGKAVPPPPLKKGSPPKEPPPAQQCTIKTTDIVHSLKIDIGNNDSQTTSAKQSLFRMLIHGDVETRRDASGMVKATESGALAGIFQRNKGPVAARGQRMTPKKGWWELIPQGQLGMCLKEPAGEAPMIIYREQEMSTSQLDTMLRQAWHQCGLPALPFPCVYEKDLGNKPQTNACLDEAEEAFLQGEQQCDAQFVNNKACQNAFKKCLSETGGQVTSCEQKVPCILHPDRNQFNACMNQVNKDRDQAKALCP